MPINSAVHFFSPGSVHIFQDPYSSEKPNQEVLDCFEPRAISQAVSYPELSLKELYAQKDSLKSLTASELIHFWENLGRAKADAENSFFRFFSSTKPEEYFDEIVPKLCDEIADRFISNRATQSGTEYLFWILNDKLTSHVIKRIFEKEGQVFERYQNAKQSGLKLERSEEAKLFLRYVFGDNKKIISRYEEAKKTDFQIDPIFAVDLFRSKNGNDVINFLQKIRSAGIDYQHLFTMPGFEENCFHQLFREKIHSYESIRSIMILAAISGVDIDFLLQQKDFMKKTPLDYTRMHFEIGKELFSAEYNALLAEAGIGKEFYSTLHGYRLASLQFHPDKAGVAGEAKFKRLSELAEKLGIK
ncbi:MAG: hypothetical protein WCK49_01890 [Myxococcaceae bacterium]